MTTVYEFRINLGWSFRKLAQEARISADIAKRAEEGKPIRPDTAKAIADAFSRALGREIKVLDIEGLHII